MGFPAGGSATLARPASLGEPTLPVCPRAGLDRGVGALASPACSGWERAGRSLCPGTPGCKVGGTRTRAGSTRQQVAGVPGRVRRAGEARLKGNADAQPVPTLHAAPPRPPRPRLSRAGPRLSVRWGEGLTWCPNEALGLCQRRGRSRPGSQWRAAVAKPLCWDGAVGTPRTECAGRPSFGNEMCAMPALLSALILRLPLCYLWRQMPRRTYGEENFKHKRPLLGGNWRSPCLALLQTSFQLTLAD